MSLLPFTCRAMFSRDRDVRRLNWLLRRENLSDEHRTVLERIRDHVQLYSFSQWNRPGERETVRVLFNLYRGASVRITQRV